MVVFCFSFFFRTKKREKGQVKQSYKYEDGNKINRLDFRFQAFIILGINSGLGMRGIFVN